ncbi:MAG: hypothetical protein ACYS7M_16150 [Planctomycetota bacterium]
MAVSLGSGLEKAPGSIVFELGRRLEVVPVGTMQAILRGLGLRWPGLKDNTWGKRTERGWREAATLVGADTFTVKSPYDSTERPAKFYAPHIGADGATPRGWSCSTADARGGSARASRSGGGLEASLADAWRHRLARRRGLPLLSSTGGKPLRREHA